MGVEEHNDVGRGVGGGLISGEEDGGGGVSQRDCLISAVELLPIHHHEPDKEISQIHPTHSFPLLL